MTARRDGRRSSRGRGVWGALLALSVLAVLAFVVGAVAGLVWKEPGLLVAYLSGNTSEVAWSDRGPVETEVAEVAPEAEVEPPAAVAAPPKPAPRVAAKPPAPAPKPAVAPSAPKRTPPPVAAAPPRVAVQVGAFAERASAELLKGELQKGGYPAYVAAGAGSGPRWRVRVGPYASRNEADAVAARLKSGRSLPTWVLDEDAE